MKTIAFFDFDGTITTKDSLGEFIKFAVGNKAYYIGLLKLSFTLLAYKLKLMPNHEAKEKLFTYFFKDFDENKFKKIAFDYSTQELGNIIRKNALEKIAWHKENKHIVVVVSASMQCWLQAWCDKHSLELLSTKLEFINGKATGKFSTKNCFGIEKVNRIKEKYNLKDFDEIFAYGDSNGDKEMLKIATKPHYKVF